MSFLEIALQYAARGWFVHPLGRAEKRPITGHGKDDATTEPAVIREWWSKWPNANIGIAGGPSWLLVFDADHGLNTEVPLSFGDHSSFFQILDLSSIKWLKSELSRSGTREGLQSPSSTVATSVVRTFS